MKVLYIDPYVNTPYSKKYSYYNDIYKELKKICNCYLYQNRYFKDIDTPLQESFNKGFIPDIIFFGIGWFNLEKNTFNQNLGLDKIDIPCIGYFFKAQNHLNEKLNFIKLNNFNLMMSSPPKCKDYEERSGIKFKLFPLGANPKIFFNRKIRKKYDVGFSGALHDNKHYIEGSFKTINIRRRAQNILSEEKGITSFLNGSDKVEKRIDSNIEYAKRINRSKIWLATLAPQEEVTPRYFEIGMSNTLLFCSEIPDEYSEILKDNLNCIVFKNNLSDFLEKFYYCLNNWSECQKIIEYSYKDFHQNHTWAVRAKTLKDEFINILGNKF